MALLLIGSANCFLSSLLSGVGLSGDLVMTWLLQLLETSLHWLAAGLAGLATGLDLTVMGRLDSR
jgi:hypothetical protein